MSSNARKHFKYILRLRLGDSRFLHVSLSWNWRTLGRWYEYEWKRWWIRQFSLGGMHFQYGMLGEADARKLRAQQQEAIRQAQERFVLLRPASR
jgi:hypothetical protein